MTDSDRVMITALSLFLGALMLLPALSLADELDDYIKQTGPFSLTIRSECRVVTHIIEGDYVVCQEGKERVWRRVEK